MAENQSRYIFPATFLWGTATSSHQVEGGNTNNNWWAAEQVGGIVYKDQESGNACEWWSNPEPDFDRMASLNLNTHRLSIEWSRVQPRPDTWSEPALARYRQMIEMLLERGIKPMVTLHHFTNPLWMAVLGGWENKESVKWFERYVRRVVKELGDLVDLWCTINEPMVLLGMGYLLGRWPPHNKSLFALYKAGMNMVRAHAAAYHAIHEISPGSRVGIAKHMVVWSPQRGWIPTDYLVARLVNRLSNRVFLNALTRGRVRLPLKGPVNLNEAAGTLDWLGINYYQRYRVGIRISNILRTLIPRLPANIFYHGTNPGYQKGPGDWGEIHPEGMYDTLQSVREYDLPIYITENGIPDRDDVHRPRFILTHLHQLWKAIQEGIPVKGYYYWSLVDNFEWTEGYNPDFRFGLYGVDFETQHRKLRLSGRLFGKICRKNGLTPELVKRFDPDLHPQLYSEAAGG